MKEMIAYAILDGKGRLVLDCGTPMLYKTKKAALETLILDEEETVQKVRITEA